MWSVEYYRLRRRAPFVIEVQEKLTQVISTWPKGLPRTAYAVDLLPRDARWSLCWGIAFSIEALALLRQVLLKDVLSGDLLVSVLTVLGIHVVSCVTALVWRRRCERPK